MREPIDYADDPVGPLANSGYAERRPQGERDPDGCLVCACVFAVAGLMVGLALGVWL